MDFALARYNDDGSLDVRFSDDGKIRQIWELVILQTQYPLKVMTK